MSIGEAVLEKPIALIVEDDDVTLREREGLCKSLGYQTIGVTTSWDALREFRATPAIDIVITDINLDVKNADDRSGLDLARVISRQRMDLPIVGYSGLIQDIDKIELEVFRRFVPRGRPVDELIQTFEELRSEALDYRRKRVDKAKDDLTRFQLRHTIEKPEVAIRAEYTPTNIHASSSSREEDLDDSPPEPDEQLRRSGYRLFIINAPYNVHVEGEDVVVRTVEAIPIWFRTEDGYHVAELYGHSCIYAEHDTEQGALEAIVILMHGYHLDFQVDPDQPRAPALAQLRDYLRTVFG